MQPAMRAFLRQDMHEGSTLGDSMDRMLGLLNEGRPA